MQFFKENVKDENDSLPADNHRTFLQMDTMFFMYLKKEVCDEVDFLHAGKHESFLQIDTMIFNENGQAFPEFSK